MTLLIKNLMPSPRARAFKNLMPSPRAPVLISPRPMHETRRMILKKLSARMNAEKGFVA